MHANDFRDDLEPTLAQWRAIAKGMCELSGEPAPPSRSAALELILRLEAEPAAGTGAVAGTGTGDVARSLIATASDREAAHRDLASRTGARR